MRNEIAFRLGVVAVAVIAVVFGVSVSEKADTPAPVPVFTACEHEDSLNCVWLASEQGNRLGTSFISGPIEQPVYPISDDAARHLLTLTR